MTVTGRCFCGQVHYTIDAAPVGGRVCWCRDCQYIASGSATNNILFPEDAVTFEGEIGRIEKIADSGNKVERGFCTGCGSQLYSRTIEPKGMPMRIRAGTLDDPELFQPTDVIWTSSAPSWAAIQPDLPQHPKGPK
ncbi:MAG: GFA family protein [Novosphingobium sp.]|nr:GFA family protein [Novosphingobium sp.]